MAGPASPSEEPRIGLTSDERRLVTVLFVDVVGSTGVAERLDAEDWKAIINGAFASLTGPIDRYGGTIAQYLGDGFLAFFGAPIAHEDDAERAVHAALEVLESAGTYANDVRARFGVEFAVRIGINTGPVVVGAVGTQQRHEYLAVGDTVNVAARLQAMAKPMTALVSDSTRRLIRDGIDLADVGVVEVRGRTAPIRAFSPLRARTRAPTDDRRQSFASPMVGRTAELARLTSAADALQGGHGGVVVLLGEPGIGKSRLLREWRTNVEARGTRWAQANMPAHASGVAYTLAAEAARAMLALAPEATAAELDLALDRAGGGDDLVSRRPYLADLLSIRQADGGAESERLTPLGRQARYVETVQAVARAAAREPLVAVLNDTHWSDPSSIALLAPLVALHADLPLLVCIVTRPEPESAGWRLVEAARRATGSDLVEIRLESLPVEHTERLLANLLDAHDPPEGVSEFVAARAEGNPLFVEEIVRMLVERRLLVRGDAAWSFDPDRSSEIPDTLQAVLAARIDRLEPETRMALRVASVLGRQFSVPVLERLLRVAT